MGEVDRSGAMKQIEVKNLTKFYGNFPAVINLNFAIDKGEIVGFLGPNGAGKTTTMKIITTYMAPTSGEVYVGGLDVFEHEDEVKQLIGYLPENNPLPPELIVYDYLDFIGKVRGLPTDYLRSRISYAVERCGLDAVVYRPISQLSKGYRQRVGLAQAILHDPSILILDEPTSGLDPNQIAEIRQLIIELGQEKTVVLSTHILQEVQAVCDRIMIINKGRIVADSPKETLQYSVSGQGILDMVLKTQDLAIIDEIKQVEGVVDAILMKKEPETLELEVHTSAEVDPREALFDLCVDKGAKILELSRRSLSLEDIFRQLTLEEKKEEAENEVE